MAPAAKAVVHMSGGNSTYRILGIDPGLNITGYGLIVCRGRDFAVEEAGVIRPPNNAPMPQRLAGLHAELAELIAQTRPDALAVEKLYAHYAHPRTSILMGHARGVILLAAAQAGLPVYDEPATEVKKSLTGHGHASKQQVQKAIQSLCRLAEVPEPPDVADALAIALCASRRIGQPLS